jgi:DNA-binding transcriptional ArsR family regulator
MINLIEGKINLGEKGISVASNYEDLSSLAEEGIIERREGPGGMYYYVEAERDGMRFGVFISLRNKRIEWLLLRWLDRPMKSWDDVSEKGLIDEYRLLTNLVEKIIGRPPDNKKNRQRTWHFKWGQVEVSYEPRSFDVAIFMGTR